FAGADDLGNMFQFYRDFDHICNRVRDVGFSKILNPELKSFDKWLAENAKRIPLD
ncbi:nucleoside-diphosphate sugar epimerase, partial [Pontibacter sp. HJ8]